MDAVDVMNSSYHPFFEDLTNVSNGGDNIWYGPPAKELSKWNCFEEKPELQPFIKQVGDAIKFHWHNKSSVMEYETVFLFSELNDSRDNIPQKAHVDMASEITDFEAKCIGTKSLIGFTPINPDGMMIVVWTDGRHKKHRTEEEIKMDHERRVKNIYVCPGQYFLYIPRGVFVALPGDTIHAGGFCFGRKFKCPMKKTSKQKERFFQNQRLHFTFCCSSLAVEEAEGEDKIIIVGDNTKICKKDFEPNKEIMNMLFNNLLDHHEKYKPHKVEGKPPKKQKKIDVNSSSSIS